MKNYEKYAEEIKKYRGYNFCDNFVMPYILKTSDCSKDEIYCTACQMKQMIWLFEEYEEPECKEPEIDWNNVAVDTPILVKEYKNGEWYKRYFTKYEDEVVCAWINGCTSWSADGAIMSWKYAKLATEEESAE